MRTSDFRMELDVNTLVEICKHISDPVDILHFRMMNKRIYIHTILKRRHIFSRLMRDLKENTYLTTYSTGGSKALTRTIVWWNKTYNIYHFDLSSLSTKEIIDHTYVKCYLGDPLR